MPKFERKFRLNVNVIEITIIECPLRLLDGNLGINGSFNRHRHPFGVLCLFYVINRFKFAFIYSAIVTLFSYF